MQWNLPDVRLVKTQVKARQGAATGCAYADCAPWLSVLACGHCGLPVRFHSPSVHLKMCRRSTVQRPSDPNIFIPRIPWMRMSCLKYLSTAAKPARHAWHPTCGPHPSPSPKSRTSGRASSNKLMPRQRVCTGGRGSWKRRASSRASHAVRSPPACPRFWRRCGPKVGCQDGELLGISMGHQDARR